MSAIAIEFEVTPEQIAKLLKQAHSVRDSRQWISGLMEQLDADAYAEVAAFVAVNPIDKIAECPRCHRRSYVFPHKDGSPCRCSNCMAVMLEPIRMDGVGMMPVSESAK